MIRICSDFSDNVQNVQNMFRPFRQCSEAVQNFQSMLIMFRICSDFFRISSTKTGLFRMSWLCSGNKTVGAEARGGYVATTYHKVINPQNRNKNHMLHFLDITILYISKSFSNLKYDRLIVCCLTYKKKYFFGYSDVNYESWQTFNAQYTIIDSECIENHTYNLHYILVHLSNNIFKVIYT